MVDLKIIFDQYGHPNQPFWVNWYKLISSADYSMQTFASKNLSGHDNGILELKKKSRISKLQNILYSLISYKSITGSLSTSQYHYLIKKPAKVIHFLNAQMFHELEPMIAPNGKFLFTFRGYDTLVRPGKDLVWQQQLHDIYNKAFKLHFVSDYLKTEAIKLGAKEDKCVVIPRSVDTDFFKPSRKDKIGNPIKILSVGRLTWEKGLSYGLSALAALKKEGFDFHYTICGEGHEYDVLNHLVKTNGLIENVSFIGQQSPEDIRIQLNKANIFLHPSLSEGLPNSVLEAMAMKLPVISTFVGGIPEAIENQVSGILVEPKDTQGLKDALEKLLTSSTLRMSIGDSARARILNSFSQEREKADWFSLYDTCLN